jgi:hypothetical protein
MAGWGQHGGSLSESLAVGSRSIEATAAVADWGVHNALHVPEGGFLSGCSLCGSLANREGRLRMLLGIFQQSLSLGTVAACVKGRPQRAPSLSIRAHSARMLPTLACRALKPWE